MSTPIVIKNGTGTNVKANVTSENAVRVSTVPISASEVDVNILTRYKVLREFFIDTSSSRNLNINGSITNVEFKISSSINKVKYITSLRFIFNDGNMDMSTAGQLTRFGDAAATPGLTNGLNLTISQSGTITEIFPDSIKNIGDFLNYSDGFTNIKDAVSAGIDFLSFDFNFEQPIVLTTDNLDKISVTIKDNLTAVTFFNVLARGYQEFI